MMEICHVSFHFIFLEYALRVHYEACTLRLLRLVKVPLSTLFKRPELCIFRSEMITLNNVWNAKVNK